MFELNFIWPAIWARSSTGDWLFLLTTLHSLSFSLSPPFKRAKCSPTPRQSKISKIFTESMPPDPLTSLFLYYGPHAPPPPPPPLSTKNPGYAPVLLLLWFKLSPVRVSSLKRTSLHQLQITLARLSDFTILLRHRIHRASLDIGESQTRETGFEGVKDIDCKCVFSFSWSHQNVRKRRRNDSKTNARAVFWFVKLRPLVIWSGTRDAIFEPRKMRITVEAISCKWYKSTRLQGWILKFQKGGAGSRILEREGGRNLTFQCRFPSFSYKSLTNIPPKGGGPGPSGPSPKSAPRLSLPPLRSGRSRLLRAFSAHPSASHSVTNT